MAMARVIWDGTGELPDGAAYFTTRDGTLRGRDYVRARVSAYLSEQYGRFFRGFASFSLDARRAAIAATVDNDEWLGSRNGCLVEAVCRDVLDHLLGL
jgi:hypothetical protein